jgi:hypothetical protein
MNQISMEREDMRSRWKENLLVIVGVLFAFLGALSLENAVTLGLTGSRESGGSLMMAVAFLGVAVALGHEVGKMMKNQ